MTLGGRITDRHRMRARVRRPAAAGHPIRTAPIGIPAHVARNAYPGRRNTAADPAIDAVTGTVGVSCSRAGRVGMRAAICDGSAVGLRYTLGLGSTSGGCMTGGVRFGHTHGMSPSARAGMPLGMRLALRIGDTVT